MHQSIAVSALNIYPIKSCRGISVAAAPIGPRGFAHDREWMVVTPAGRFLTQREIPHLALIQPKLRDDGALVVQMSGSPSLVIRADTPRERRDVTIWRDQCQAIDAGENAAIWFSAVLGVSCRLVRFDPATVRAVHPDFAQNDGDQVGFADGYPFLILSEASLTDLNERLTMPLPMNRFRPNIVVRGCAAFAEDSWQRVQIGEAALALVKPCARCVITTTDQQNANIGKEPLRTLATYRNSERGVLFGQNAIHLTSGTIHVGDQVQILTQKADATRNT